MIQRRTLISAAAATGAATLIPTTQSTNAHAAFTVNPFQLGVASGDVTTSEVVIWTRLVPKPVDAASNFGMGNSDPVEIQWRLADSESDLADRAKCRDSGTTSCRNYDGFSTRVKVSQLPADQEFYYQFRVGTWVSPVGRTRTAPLPTSTRPIKFAVVHCQCLAAGNGPAYFHGWREIAHRNDLDFVVILGDYIYEFGRAAHIPAREIKSLSDYRTRYGQYKQRRYLKEAHQRWPVYAIPDDHEFFNDLSGGALGSNVRRFNNAIEAYWENLPFGEPRPGPVLSSTPNRMKTWREIRWGSSLDMFLADTRQWRTSQTMLGSRQMDALMKWLTASTGTWSVLGVGQPLTGVGRRGNWLPADRLKITSEMLRRKKETPKTFNPLVIGGDFHCGLMTHTRLKGDATSELVATEVVNVPMASGGNRAFRPALDPGALRKAYNKPGDNWENYRGYSVITVSPSLLDVRFRLTDQHMQESGRIQSRDRWTLDAGAKVGDIKQLD